MQLLTAKPSNDYDFVLLCLNEETEESKSKSFYAPYLKIRTEDFQRSGKLSKVKIGLNSHHLVVSPELIFIQGVIMLA